MLRNKTIRAGELDIRLVIELNTPTVTTSTGDRVDSWAVVNTVWSKRVVQGGRDRGREGFEADQQVATKIETYLIRYSSDVSGVVENNYRIYESGTTDYIYVTAVDTQKREGWITIKGEMKDG